MITRFPWLTVALFPAVVTLWIAIIKLVAITVRRSAVDVESYLGGQRRH